jgi:hypothetical protein
MCINWRRRRQVVASDDLAAIPLPPAYLVVAERPTDLTPDRELLALFDAVRGGSAREQALALKLLEERLQP